SGAATSSGSLGLSTSDAGAAGVSGQVTLSSGTASSGTSGAVGIESGSSEFGSGGAISLSVGSGDGAGGTLSLSAGDSSADDGGLVQSIASGSSQTSGQRRGDESDRGPGQHLRRRAVDRRRPWIDGPGRGRHHQVRVDSGAATSRHG
ncbi:hypothetical protein THAOC_17786, partial [Thalassiosira oceanica]